MDLCSEEFREAYGKEIEALLKRIWPSPMLWPESQQSPNYQGHFIIEFDVNLVASGAAIKFYSRPSHTTDSWIEIKTPKDVCARKVLRATLLEMVRQVEGE